MATHTQVVVVSDLSGGQGAETVTVGFDGRWVEIDLLPAEREHLEEFLAPYLSAGRDVHITRRTRQRAVVEKEKEPVEEEPPPAPRVVREWARANGVEVGERGRIPPDVMEAYVNRERR